LWLFCLWLPFLVLCLGACVRHVFQRAESRQLGNVPRQSGA
jgi:hypothetical protein